MYVHIYERSIVFGDVYSQKKKKKSSKYKIVQHQDYDVFLICVTDALVIQQVCNQCTMYTFYLFGYCCFLKP